MSELRSAFPVTERLAYLNAGTDGPVPAVARRAAVEALDGQAEVGRHAPHFEERTEGQAALRRAYADLLNCAAADVALTTSATEGLGKVIAGLDLGPGDEIVTSDQEHPGLLGPLTAAAARGARVHAVPLGAIAAAVDEATTLVACSHVGWVTGEEADPALREVDVPVVLDGAQAAGALDFEVGALGCAAYAAAGQKWLCGADGTGFLYVDPAFADRVRPVAPGYMSFADPALGVLHADARRHDTASLPREGVALSLASAELLAGYGWARVHAEGVELAAQLAAELAGRGRIVAPRGSTTLVAWEEDDPTATASRLAEAGVIVRHLPGRPYVRASVGAWNDESDLERLLAAL